MPALLKIGVVFMAVVVSLKFKCPLGVSLLIGSIVLGLWFGMPAGSLVGSLVIGVLSVKSLLLLLIIGMIMTFSAVLAETKQLWEMVSAVGRVVRNPRFSVPAMSAIIGLLPMPGGARFSAPLLAEAAKRINVSPARKSAINFWFRHIWEYWWPFYPAVLILSSLSGLSLARIFQLFVPATLISVIIGYLFYLRPLPRQSAEATTTSPGSVLALIGATRPILAVIAVNFGLSAALKLCGGPGGALGWVPSRAPLIASLAIGLAIALWRRGLGTKRFLRLVFNRRVGSIVLTVAAVLVFGQVLSDSAAIKEVTSSLARNRAPLALIVAATPFLISLVTGLVTAEVGIGLPILLPVLCASLSPQEVPAYIVLFYLSGFVGVLISPVHLCLLLSNEYFGVRYAQTARLLLLPCVVMLAASFGLFGLYRLL